MFTDDKEPKEYNPVEKFLVKNDSADLLGDDSTLHPELLEQCTFERNGSNYVGTFEDEELGLSAKYEILPYSKDTKKLEFTFEAPIRLWPNWQEQFPKDFVVAMMHNSPLLAVNTLLPLTVFQEFIFAKDGLIRNTVAALSIPNGFDTAHVFKMNNQPTKVSFDSCRRNREYRLPLSF
jgi:hypothetical protein